MIGMCPSSEHALIMTASPDTDRYIMIDRPIVIIILIRILILIMFLMGALIIIIIILLILTILIIPASPLTDRPWDDVVAV